VRRKALTETLDRLAAEYPSLPPAVVLKTALLSLGVRFSPLLAEAAADVLPDFRPYKTPDGKIVQTPYLMILENGSLVRLRCSHDSPFSIERNGLGYMLLDMGHPATALTFARRPVWHARNASDGSSLASSGLNQHGDMMVLNVTPACEYWATTQNHSGKEKAGKSYRCGFCGYGAPDDRSRALGQEIGNPHIPSFVLQRAAEAVGVGVEAGARHLYLTGGSMTDPEKEADRYLEIVKAVREASRGVYLALGSQALPPERIGEFRDAGADGACFNLEVWDGAVWARVCPGKARFLGRGMWEDSLIEAVRVFGEGNVYSAFVIGAEMVLDGTLSEPEVALRSNLEGVRWLLSRGVQPIMSLFWSFVGTDMEGARGPDLHYLLRLYAGANEIRKELGRPFPDTMACKRCLYMQVEGDF
jgi:hypothetical protein